MNGYGVIQADGICPIYNPNTPKEVSFFGLSLIPLSQSVAAFRQLQSSLNDFKCGIQNWLPILDLSRVM